MIMETISDEIKLEISGKMQGNKYIKFKTEKEIFGSRLTRLRDAGKDRWSKSRGLYKCDCGTEKFIDDCLSIH